MVHMSSHMYYKPVKGAKPHKVLNAPDGHIQFNGKDEDWVQMRDAMVDVIETGTGRGIRTPMYKLQEKQVQHRSKVLRKGEKI